MALKGPIILIEDDEHDSDAIVQAIQEVGVKNEIIVFSGATEALKYLMETKEQPFFLLCDIKMPVLDGLLFRKKIIENEYLKKKSIPFVFFTGVVTQEIINTAYDLDVQGFYQKENSYEKLKQQLLTICMYWKFSLHPNSTGLKS